MHCYRVTTFHASDPTYILMRMQDGAFKMARENTTQHRSPVVALIDLPTDKATLVEGFNDPQFFIGKQPALKVWEFYKRGTMNCCRELNPVDELPMHSKKPFKVDDKGERARKPRAHPTVKEAAKSNPNGWPQVMLLGTK